jgi:hypothetical protein
MAGNQQANDDDDNRRNLFRADSADAHHQGEALPCADGGNPLANRHIQPGEQALLNGNRQSQRRKGEHSSSQAGAIAAGLADDRARSCASSGRFIAS